MTTESKSIQVTRHIRPEEIDAFFKASFNILFVGKHGVGKTAQIKACFEKHGLIRNETYLYFSASTLDPWVDLIGVPKEVNDGNGNVYLDLVRPKALSTGKVEAIFFDEFNRSPKKVRNAVMELLQFKSINGLEFPNLKCIWAAINPDEDETYDVEKIDPAQKDRFEVHVDIPYECNMEFFSTRFGKEIATPALEWWNELPSTVKDHVTPRRLDYALTALEKGLTLDFILPVSSNINKLVQSIKVGPISDKLEKLINKKDETNSKIFLSNSNNFDPAMKHIVQNEMWLNFFLPLAPKERLSALLTKNDVIRNYMLANMDKNEMFATMMREILIANENDVLCSKIRSAMSKINSVIPTKKENLSCDIDKPHFNNFNQKEIQSEIDDISCKIASKNYDCSNSLKRTASLCKIKTIIPVHFDEKTALTFLFALNEIVSLSMAHILNSPDYNCLCGIINKCIEELRSHKKISNTDSIESLIKKEPSLNNLFNKLKMTILYNRLDRN